MMALSAAPTPASTTCKRSVGAARGVVVREGAPLPELPREAPASLRPEVVEEEQHWFLQVVGLFDAGVAPEDLDPLPRELVIHPRGLVEVDRHVLVVLHPLRRRDARALPLEDYARRWRPAEFCTLDRLAVAHRDAERAEPVGAGTRGSAGREGGGRQSRGRTDSR